MKRTWMVLAAAIVTIAGGLAGFTHYGSPHRESTSPGSTYPGAMHPRATYPRATNGEETTSLPRFQQEKVLVVGGSMARGWLDPKRDSYIRRAFSELSETTPVRWQYVDHSRPGSRAVDFRHQYPEWLTQDHPQVVAISWGLLNDCHKHTPMVRFRRAIRSEIATALAQHSVVMIITPPVTEASSTYFRHSTARYVNAELKVARAFHNPNVHIYDVLGQMRRYLAAHGQTYQAYKGNAWHPNRAGHRLAGEVLYADIVQTLGRGPIHYREFPQITEATTVQSVRY
ncbi:SGNH/GDSL hydrolase family protein [Alicyclobacillus herbarius]|uniref:SGNH/GDSL hydrolase family protein n=1 Tax=Alicyclobacillus herbarius TaxID=122960 RepID=UPI00047A3C39|nr:SGNH/GDSL hydrolase family protein [Alicyclobacillus herbarius]